MVSCYRFVRMMTLRWACSCNCFRFFFFFYNSFAFVDSFRFKLSGKNKMLETTRKDTALYLKLSGTIEMLVRYVRNVMACFAKWSSLGLESSLHVNDLDQARASSAIRKVHLICSVRIDPPLSCTCILMQSSPPQNLYRKSRKLQHTPRLVSSLIKTDNVRSSGKANSRHCSYPT